MDKKKVLTCKEGSSNKYWQYEIINDKQVKFSWGRIGLDGQDMTETFATQDKMHKKINSKVAEKHKKGYKETDNLKKESEIAQLIGPRNKINEVQFVRVSNDTITELGEYDPNQSVLIELIDSWSKEKIHYLLNKKQSWHVMLSNNRIVSKYEQYENQTIAGIRKSLEAVAAAVKIAVQKFGFAIRALQIDDNETTQLPTATNENLYTEVFNNIGDTVSKQVISKFAGLGVRSLELD